jgi:ligand-binding sensor protein
MDNPLEIMSAEQWDELLEELASDSLMTSALLDSQGAVLRTHGRRNALCKMIRQEGESRTSICSQTSAAMLEMVRVTLGPVIEECEAGMMRVVIPVVRGGVLAYQVALCGRLAHDGQIETFLLSKLMRVGEDDVSDLSRSVTLVARKYLRDLAERTFLRLNPDQTAAPSPQP